MDTRVRISTRTKQKIKEVEELLPLIKELEPIQQVDTIIAYCLTKLKEEKHINEEKESKLHNGAEVQLEFTENNQFLENIPKLTLGA